MFQFFADYYLEDSYVLSVAENGNSFAFELEAGLCEQYPDYRIPSGDESNCFNRVVLTFSNFSHLQWLKKEFR